jgi:hypothetical protein
MTGADERQQNLFPKQANFPTGIAINDRCVIHSEQDYRIVIVSGIPLAQYAIKDKMAEGYAMVSLVERGWASQKEVARAFGCSTRTVPSRIPVNKVVGEYVVKLDPERKLLTNLVKMVACQAESDLVHLVTPHYKRAADEGRTLIQSALAGAANIEVCDGKLRIYIALFSSPHRTRAIDELCQELNRRPTFFPGSRLQLTFASSSPKTTMKRTVS